VKALYGLKVGISGAVPLLAELRKYGGSELDIHFMLRRLVERVLGEDGSIVYGSHPTFTPIIETVAPGLVGANQVGRVIMFVARHFFPKPEKWDNFFSRHSAYATVEPIGSYDMPRNSALTEMRREMIWQTDALVCIGGKFHEDDTANQPGVEEEFGIAQKRAIPIYLIGTCGGYTRKLYEDRFADKPTMLRNHLTNIENEALAKSADVWDAIDLVMKGLGRIER
jgi:hypothetical protein